MVSSLAAGKRKPLSDSDRNPYAPPKVESVPTFDGEPEEFSVRRVCIYMRTMAIVGLLLMAGYFSAIVLFAIAEARNVNIGEIAFSLIIIAVVSSFFTFALRTSFLLLPITFDQYYQRSRWLLIIFGVMGFPFFTIPAILAGVHLERARKSMRGTAK